ncbi:MAG: hypothetical protein Q4E67_01225, partial [Planctomycetia bacterium]|nr:hypothetical protein [Planctomycetia bacterium]
ASGEGISQGTRGEIVNGHYLLEDVPVGDVRVSFNIVERIPSKNPQDVGRGIMICHRCSRKTSNRWRKKR